MSTIRVGNIGPLTGNTSVIADPGVSGGGMSLVSMGAVTASGTSVDFTGIPSWVRRVTLNFSALSATGSASQLLLRLGTSSGTVTTGYLTTAGYYGSSSSVVSSTNGWLSSGWTITNPFYLTGTMIFNFVGSNTWIGNCQYMADSGGNYVNHMTGKIALSSVLTTVIVTTTAGATFNSGIINLFYE